MIRHRPHGLGHPYAAEPDRRVPAIPIAGEPVTIRATTPAGVRRLRVELVSAHGESLHAARRVPAEAPFTTDGGHLGAASAAGSGARQRWTACFAAPPAGESWRYRLRAGAESTPWFRAASAVWMGSGGRLLADGGATDRLVEGSARWLCVNGRPVRCRFALRLDPGEHVCGFGERFDRLDQRGYRLDATVFEQYKHQGNRTYLPMPFAIVAGSSGWGFHVDTHRRTTYDVGASDPDRVWVEVDLDPEGAEREVELHLFAGGPKEVLSAFLDAAGRPSPPPAWVYEPWMSGNEWNTQARVLSEVEKSLELDIPAGVVVIEAWSDEATFYVFRDAHYVPRQDGAPLRLGDFTFPPAGAWPDPKAMVDRLHELGFRVLLWQIPLQKIRTPKNAQARHDRDCMLRSGYGVRSKRRAYRNRGWWFPQSLLIDFTNPEARDWWLSKRRYLVEEVGVDGFKTDGGEHAWGEDLRYADGARGTAGNNRYPVLYQAAYHDLMQSLGRPPVTFSRAGFTGAQSFPGHWAGDEDSTWDAYRASITAGITAGACGVFFWSWDLAGFSGPPPGAELYLRAAAMACFSPIMQFHSEFNHHRAPSRDRTPWNVAEQTGDARVLPVYRRFAHLRRALIPYLQEQAALAIVTGRPLMAALFFDHPADPEVWRWPHQYMLGTDLLVAPVIEPAQEVASVYLPEGAWEELWSGQRFTGGNIAVVAAPLDRIPVFVRWGRPSPQLAPVLARARSG